jgi:hypothetical protein
MHPFHQSVCLYMHPTIVARQRLGKNVTAEIIHTIELLNASFAMRCVVSQENRRLDLPRTSLFLLHSFREEGTGDWKKLHNEEHH